MYRTFLLPFGNWEIRLSIYKTNICNSRFTIPYLYESCQGKEFLLWLNRKKKCIMMLLKWQEGLMMDMTYESAMDYMREVQKRGSILGLEPVKELLNRLGNPQNKLKVIHIAGTNGKGSICTFLEQMYKAEGLKVGRYISPTLHTYLERFQINGHFMEEDTFGNLFSPVYQALQDMKENGQELPTAFEIETAIAFLYFYYEKVDIVILETGMGGREDATNVVSNPLCVVFASIGMDHMQFLGDTIEKIAYEKAGIIKAGSYVVGYPNTDSVNAILKEEYDKVSANLVDIKSKHNTKASAKNEMVKMPYFIKKEDVVILEETLHGSTFLYKGEEYSISLAGRYQIYNAATAIQTKLLLDGYVNKASLLLAKWEGRFEIVGENPLFIKDGAHNIDGVYALKESLEKHFTNCHLIFIIGVLKDKEYEKMMKLLCPLAAKVYTLTPAVERGLSGKILAEAVMPYCKDVTYCESVKMAVSEAKTFAGKQSQKSVIVAWGSLSYIGEI